MQIKRQDLVAAIRDTLDEQLSDYVPTSSGQVTVEDQAPADLEFETVFDGETFYVQTGGRTVKVSIMGPLNSHA